MAVTATTANIWWRRLRQNNLSLKPFFKRTSHEWCPLLVDISQYSSLLHHTSVLILPTSVSSAAQIQSYKKPTVPLKAFLFSFPTCSNNHTCFYDMHPHLQWIHGKYKEMPEAIYSSPPKWDGFLYHKRILTGIGIPVMTEVAHFKHKLANPLCFSFPFPILRIQWNYISWCSQILNHKCCKWFPFWHYPHRQQTILK